MEEKPNTLSMWKYSVVGFVGVIVFNLIAHQVLKLSGSPVSVAIAFAVGGAIAFWFAKSEKRTPTSGERSRFLWQYSCAIAILFALPFILVSISRSQPITIWASLTILVHWIAYPLVAYFYLSDKFLGKHMKVLLPK